MKTPLYTVKALKSIALESTGEWLEKVAVKLKNKIIKDLLNT